MKLVARSFFVSSVDKDLEIVIISILITHPPSHVWISLANLVIIVPPPRTMHSFIAVICPQTGAIN